MLKHCPHCQMRYQHHIFDTDFVHECNSQNPALDQEDMIKYGTWTDFDDTVNAVSPSQFQVAANDNKLFGTRAQTEGGDTEERTRRGNRVGTTFQRKHFEYINLKQGGN